MVRQYAFEAHNQLDLRNSSTQGIAVHRILHDAYRKGFGSAMDHKAVRIGYDLYSFAATYMTMIWSHEMGHFLRARQVGGEFEIQNGQLPIPKTIMHLSPEISYLDEALSVTGGFEVNYLNVRRLQREFVEQNGHFREDLAYAFANRLMYPIYTSLIVPIDAEDPRCG